MARGAVLQLKLIENFIRVCTTYSIEHEEGTVFYDCIFSLCYEMCVVYAIRDAAVVHSRSRGG